MSAGVIKRRYSVSTDLNLWKWWEVAFEFEFGGSFGGDMKEIELDSCPWEQPLQNFPTDSQPMRSLEMPRLRLNKQYDKSVNFDWNPSVQFKSSPHPTPSKASQGPGQSVPDRCLRVLRCSRVKFISDALHLFILFSEWVGNPDQVLSLLFFSCVRPKFSLHLCWVGLLSAFHLIALDLQLNDNRKPKGVEIQNHLLQTLLSLLPVQVRSYDVMDRSGWILHVQ